MPAVLLLLFLLGCGGGASEPADPTEPASTPPSAEAPSPPGAGEPTSAVDTCEAAFRELKTLREATEGATAPSRARFLRACALLPDAARPCMSLRYTAAHRDACAAAMDALSPELVEQVKELVEG